MGLPSPWLCHHRNARKGIGWWLSIENEIEKNQKKSPIENEIEKNSEKKKLESPSLRYVLALRV